MNTESQFMHLRLSACLLFVASLVLFVSAHAQEFPTKPIRFVVPFPPGGGADRYARLVSERLWKRWGQPVIVDNRPGGGANVGAEAVFKAPPDGYTVMFGTPGPLLINKMLYKKLNYDSDAFVPVSQLTLSPNIMTLHPSVPAKTVKEFIALARQRESKMNYGSAGVGTTPHLTGELFNAAAKVKILHVAYKGSTQLMTDLMGGRLDMAFFLLANAIEQVRAEKLRALAVTSPKRSPLLPNVPVMAEALPGFISIQWVAVVAPPGTPADIVKKLNAGITDIMRQPDIIKALAATGDEVIASTPQEAAALIKREKELWGKVIRVSGATAEEP